MSQYKACEWCGKWFTSTNQRRDYCSSECASKGRELQKKRDREKSARASFATVKPVRECSAKKADVYVSRNREIWMAYKEKSTWK